MTAKKKEKSADEFDPITDDPVMNGPALVKKEEEKPEKKADFVVIDGCLRGGRVGRYPCPAAAKDRHEIRVGKWRGFDNYICECGYSITSVKKHVYEACKKAGLVK